MGWDIVHGNFQMYMNQFDPLGTSQGYWRVGAIIQPYGRFARGFNHAQGKDTMYFDLDDGFFAGGPPHAATIRIVYFDQGTGEWQLKYDAVSDPQKIAFTVMKTNTGLWKEKAITIADGHLGNRCPNGADIMLVNSDSEDDVFH
ncbi:hypothetical protein ACFL6C_11210, partial [Myxococcota bacterium]